MARPRSGRARARRRAGGPVRRPQARCWPRCGSTGRPGSAGSRRRSAPPDAHAGGDRAHRQPLLARRDWRRPAVRRRAALRSLADQPCSLNFARRSSGIGVDSCVPGITDTYVITPTHAGESSHVAVYSISNDVFPESRDAHGDSDVVVEPRRALPLDHRLHHHHVEVGEERDLRAQTERLEEASLRLVEIGQPVGVEHHALRVDFCVARANVVDEHASRAIRGARPRGPRPQRRWRAGEARRSRRR